MKKITHLIAALLVSITLYGQQAELHYKGLLLENTCYISAAGKGIAYVPQLTGVLNKHSLSMGPVLQDGKIFNQAQVVSLTGIHASYKYKLVLFEDFSELFTEFSVSYRNAAGSYEYATEISKLDISAPTLQYNVLESYAGFGIRSSLTHLFVWSASIGGGYAASENFTDYTQDGTAYTAAINDISLMLKASIGFRLFPKNNVHLKITQHENNLHNLRHSLYQ